MASDGSTKRHLPTPSRNTQSSLQLGPFWCPLCPSAAPTATPKQPGVERQFPRHTASEISVLPPRCNWNGTFKVFCFVLFLKGWKVQPLSKTCPLLALLSSKRNVQSLYKALLGDLKTHRLLTNLTTPGCLALNSGQGTSLLTGPPSMSRSGSLVGCSLRDARVS